MKTIIKTILTLLLIGTIQSATAQKKPFYNTQEQAIEAAYLTLDREMESGDLKEWAAEKGIKGAYSFKITIGGTKGAVYTILALKRSEDGEVMQQNAIKDYVKSMRFPFKMPKDKSYQFQYEFKF